MSFYSPDGSPDYHSPDMYSSVYSSECGLDFTSGNNVKSIVRGNKYSKNKSMFYYLTDYDYI